MKNNFWKAFSRGIAAFILIVAIIFGFCGLGAIFANIPWFLIAGGIFLLLIVGSVIWFMGYQSHQAQSVKEPIVQPTEGMIIIRRKMTPEEFDKAFNMFRTKNDEKEDEDEDFANLVSELTGE